MGARAALGAFVLFSSVLLVGTSLTSCESRPEVNDLYRNERIYQRPRYVASLPVDRAVFVMPIADDRDQRRPDAVEATYPRKPMPEELWDRPVLQMLDDVIREALVEAKVVARLDDTVPPAAETLVVAPKLIDLRGFLEEQPTGRCTLATFALRVVVSGPAAADGTREVLLDQSYEQSVGSQVARVPMPVPELIGKIVRETLTRVLTDFDRSNVTRSGLPLVTPPKAK